MNLLIRLIFIIGFTLLSLHLFSSEKDTLFKQKIELLNKFGSKIISADNDDEKYSANNQFKKLLKMVIQNPASFSYSFDSLKSISILQANSLKIYNWTIPKIDGTFEYFAFLQYKKHKNEYALIELIDKSGEINDPEKKILTPKNWYGALYYKIIYNKELGENTYTLLGWDGNNKLTNKKIIETIKISNNGIIKFGSTFKTGKKKEKRVIFEYAENTVMSLKYYPKEKNIIFDYLVPASSKLEGVYEYYGPSLNRFDALTIKNKNWKYKEDIKIELEKNLKDRFWKNPNTD